MEPDVVPIKQHTVMARTIAYCDAKIGDEGFAGLTLVAEGKAVNKCISVVEILKRNHTDIAAEIHLDESEQTPNEPRLRVALSKPE
jgi:DNA-binding protein